MWSLIRAHRWFWLEVGPARRSDHVEHARTWRFMPWRGRTLMRWRMVVYACKNNAAPAVMLTRRGLFISLVRSLARFPHRYRVVVVEDKPLLKYSSRVSHLMISYKLPTIWSGSKGNSVLLLKINLLKPLRKRSSSNLNNVS